MGVLVAGMPFHCRTEARSLMSLVLAATGNGRGPTPNRLSTHWRPKSGDQGCIGVHRMLML